MVCEAYVWQGAQTDASLLGPLRCLMGISGF